MSWRQAARPRGQVLDFNRNSALKPYMKEYKILRVSNFWSTKTLREEAQKLINEKSNEGWEVVSVSFGVTIWLVLSFYITLSKTK